MSRYVYKCRVKSAEVAPKLVFWRDFCISFANLHSPTLLEYGQIQYLQIADFQRYAYVFQFLLARMTSLSR